MAPEPHLGHIPAGSELRSGQADAALARDARSRGGVHDLVEHRAVDAHCVGHTEQDVRLRLLDDPRVQTVRGISPRCIAGGRQCERCIPAARQTDDGPDADSRPRDLERCDDRASHPRPERADARRVAEHGPRQPAADLLAGELPRRHVALRLHVRLDRRPVRARVLPEHVHRAQLPRPVQLCAGARHSTRWGHRNCPLHISAYSRRRAAGRS